MDSDLLSGSWTQFDARIAIERQRQIGIVVWLVKIYAGVEGLGQPQQVQSRSRADIAPVMRAMEKRLAGRGYQLVPIIVQRVGIVAGLTDQR